MIRLFLITFLLTLLLSGCFREESGSGLLTEGPQTALPAATDIVDLTVDISTGYKPSSTPTSTATHTPAPTITASPPATDTIPAPTNTPEAEKISPIEIKLDALAALFPPVIDNERLAIAYLGLAPNEMIEPPLVTEPLPIGSKESFKILDVNHITVNEIETEMLYSSDHAYFWFENRSGNLVPDQNTLTKVGDAFDGIYDGVIKYFGSERNPGIDGDPRLHIVNVSPETLCGLDIDPEAFCYTAGMVNATDLLPAQYDPRSNEREMFVMNSSTFGSEGYLGVLAHEFRHMIEDNYDKSGADWEIEGSATLAAELLNLPSGGPERANLFLENPDQQLNSWSDSNRLAHYGQGYLLNRYIFDRLGEDLYFDFATSPLQGLEALDGLAIENSLDFTGESIWLDWLVALAIHDSSNLPEKYQFMSEGLEKPVWETIEKSEGDFNRTVHQYAADYYLLPSLPVDIKFQGANDVPVIAQPPLSGDNFWMARRANYSNPRLTRAVDLRDVDKATLTFDVYSDIEYAYDFAYVSVSTDGGSTWISLAGEQMQGLDPLDNSGGSALTDRYYTGQVREWLPETIDLNPFSGQEILLRFEYVTDSVLTYGGFAVNNIAIPEIGFYDDLDNGQADQDDSWLVEGFYQTSYRIPQHWHLQLITFTEDGPIIQKFQAVGDEEVWMTADGSGLSNRPILIIAATAPYTLEESEYLLKFNGD